MIVAPLIAMGATLGTASGLIALCGLVCLCKHLQKKKSPDSGEGTPVTMASVLQPGQVMNVYKCTEPVQPQAQLRFPYVISSKQTSPEIVNCKDRSLKAVGSDELDANEAGESPTLKTISGVLISDQCVNTPPSDSEDAKKASSPQHVPKLRYSLGYDRQTAELCVSFLEAVGVLLPGEEDSGSHCYVSGMLNTQRGQTEAQTALIKRTAHTVWEEALLFPLQEEDRAQATLTLTLRNSDRFSRHQVVGEITLSLANVGIPFGTARWVDLRAPEKDVDSTSEVLLSMSYLPAANRLIVVLIKARNIHSNQNNNLVGKDLYVKVSLWHKSQRLKKKQSKRAKHKINPVWNEMIMFEVPSELLTEVRVELDMLCQEPGGGPSYSLGTCCLGSDQTATGKSHWQEMVNNHRRQIAMWHRLLP
ncbi:PREDICTED: synaptotagmin-13 [Nanorana parkeri]|uniref:synaptotagmin-13 n=1 Tax=Nanorana parkeri TaxID=125878 RepID=UPI0008543BDD|nr:PREDICTED: synaptotagmin-13 [Nanorana parkeri]